MQREIKQELIDQIAGKLAAFHAIGLLKTMFRAKGGQQSDADAKVQGKAMYDETHKDALEYATDIVNMVVNTVQMGEIVK